MTGCDYIKEQIDNLSPILIIGGAGFVGTHLIDVLSKNNYKVVATKLLHEKSTHTMCEFYDLDILNKQEIKDLINKICPKSIVHLAAQSSVKYSWDNIKETFDINVIGTTNLLNAIKEHNTKIKILIIGSSEEYGMQNEEIYKLTELSIPNPTNPYAISKYTQTLLSLMFHKAYGLDLIVMRPFNHIGPGQKKGFVVPDFCTQIVDIENNKKNPIIFTGNLEAKRDFSDVRDIANSYLLALKYGKSGEIYNIGSGKVYSIKQILDMLLSFSFVPIKVICDKSKFRPVDVKIIEANIDKFSDDTGYKPKYSLEESLKDCLDYFRILK